MTQASTSRANRPIREVARQCSAALAWLGMAAAGAGATPTPPPGASPAGHAGFEVAPLTATRAAPAPIPAAKRVDINKASRSELKALPGIGDAEADAIIRHRPFLTSTQIVTQAGLPAGLYVALKRRIVAIPPKLPVTAPALNRSAAATRPRADR